MPEKRGWGRSRLPEGCGNEIEAPMRFLMFKREDAIGITRAETSPPLLTNILTDARNSQGLGNVGSFLEVTLPKPSLKYATIYPLSVLKRSTSQ